MGNGLLTFIDKKTEFNKIFNENEVILYNTVDDLSDKINFFKKNEKSRINIAKNGQKKYFKLFNEKKISKYIIDKSLNKKNLFILMELSIIVPTFKQFNIFKMFNRIY